MKKFLILLLLSISFQFCRPPAPIHTTKIILIPVKPTPFPNPNRLRQIA